MKIAHVISSPAGIGGAERVLLRLVEVGEQLGWDQRVIHPFLAGRDTVIADLCPAGIYRSYRCDRWREVWAARTWLARQLDEFRPDIVHAHLFHALVLVASLPRPPGAGLVLTHHHGSIYDDQGRHLRTYLDRLCGRRYDVVVAVSDATRRVLVDRYHYPASKVFTIPNGWFGQPADRTSPPSHRIVCVANFRPEKAHDVLLTAFAEVVKGLPDARLVLVGDGPLRPALENQAYQLGIAARVQFAGFVPDVWPLLGEADVFVLPSRTEPSGIAALEAMAAGLPVVATRVGGLVEIVDSKRNGVLVEPNDPAAMAKELVALLDAPETMAAMGEASRRAATEHSADEMARRYVDLYTRLGEGES